MPLEDAEIVRMVVDIRLVVGVQPREVDDVFDVVASDIAVMVNTLN